MKGFLKVKYDVIKFNVERLRKKINVNNNRTKLHRWCNSTSEYYKNKCDWEKKFINANKDNCFSN